MITIILIIIFVLCLYKHFRPSIDIIMNTNTKSIILWYNIYETGDIKRVYKVLITLKT